MTRNRVAGLSVLALAVGIIVWRESRRAGPPDDPQSMTRPGPAVILFADLSETGEEEGCGAIIRHVRRGAARGLATQEVDSRRASDARSRYRLLMAPAVVFLDGSGRETARYKGEAPETIRAIGAHIDRVLASR